VGILTLTFDLES